MFHLDQYANVALNTWHQKESIARIEKMHFMS